jgi:hypothetical protein
VAIFVSRSTVLLSVRVEVTSGSGTPAGQVTESVNVEAVKAGSKTLYLSVNPGLAYGVSHLMPTNKPSTSSKVTLPVTPSPCKIQIAFLLMFDY